LLGGGAVTLNATTLARISAEFARANLAGDRVGRDAAILALSADLESDQADDDTISLLVAVQARQIAMLAGKVADVLDIDPDAVFAFVAQIELPE
jgi:hypothetical protein